MGLMKKSISTSSNSAIRGGNVLIALIKGEITQDEYMRANNISIFYKNLPSYIDGLVIRYRDINMIVINKWLSKKKANLTILHEFAHLELNHLDKFVFEYKRKGIEDEADKYVEFLLNEAKIC